VADFLRKNFPKEEYEALWEFVCRWIEGYDAADVERASAFGLRDEMFNTSTWLQRNIKEGYGPLIRFLQAECEKNGSSFLLRREVVGIEAAQSHVAVRCAAGRAYSARFAVVTVPLPLLGRISFTPAIPEKFQAAEEVGYGAVIKILLRFKRKWWTGVREHIFERMFFMLSNEAVPTWWTKYPEPRAVLTGWLPGSHAIEVSLRPEEEILELALQSLANIFTISREELREELLHYKVVNWPKDPYARGVYSYATPWSSAAIRKLQEPLGGKVFLAGEALSRDDTGTVEAALSSGERVATHILSLR
jgi:monoamine oxidase